MLKLNREVFFSKVRKGPFPGRLTQSQVSGMNTLLDVWEERGTDDERHLAYVLATDFHETGMKMQPVREGFKTSDKAAREYVQRNYGHKGRNWYSWPRGPWGHVYYGRGDVQLTWYGNYVKMGATLGLPLAEKPDLALDPKVSKMILVEGMLRGQSSAGDFTGKALEDFFNDEKDDPYNARRIVNVLDKAALIQSYHDEFLDAVESAVEAYEAPSLFLEGVDYTVEAPASRPAKTDPVSWGAILTAVGGLGGTVAGITKNMSGPGALVAVGVIVIGAVLIIRGRTRILKVTGE